MVPRLVSRWWASRRISKAMSSRRQDVSGCWWSSVVRPASAMTWSRSEGGKVPGSARTWSVLKAGPPAGDVAFAPLTHSMAVAVESVGYLLVGGLLGLCGRQDDPAAEHQRLRRGWRANERVACLALLGRKIHGGSKSRATQRLKLG